MIVVVDVDFELDRPDSDRTFEFTATASVDLGPGHPYRRDAEPAEVSWRFVTNTEDGTRYLPADFERIFGATLDAHEQAAVDLAIEIAAEGGGDDDDPIDWAAE